MNIFKRKPKSDPLLDQLVRNHRQQQRRQRWQQRWAGTSSFLSHGAWQGIGGIAGIISLIVTIVLTVYIYNIGREEQIANFTSYYSVDKVGDRWFLVVLLQNTGPASSEGLVLRVKNLSNSIDIPSCRQEDIFTRGQLVAISPDAYTTYEEHCVLLYNRRVLPSQFTKYFVALQSKSNIDNIMQHRSKELIDSLFQIEIKSSNAKLVNSIYMDE